MPKKIGTVDRSVLTSAGLPPATATYTVISHSFAINTVLQALEDNGFEVTEEEYKCTTDAQVAHGSFMINYQGDPDLSLMYTFSNSYNKKVKFKAAIGARVNTNGAYMVSQMDSWLRKHTGTADQEATTLINDHIENALEYYDQLKRDKEAMQEISISKSEYGAILGELFMNDYLAVDQISCIRKEYKNPSYPYADGAGNLWTCYLKIADALRNSHPSKWMNSQVAVHLYFVTKYNLTAFDEDESTENDYSADAIANTTEVIDETVSEEISLPGFRLMNEVVEDYNNNSLDDVNKEDEVEEEAVEASVPEGIGNILNLGLGTPPAEYDLPEEAVEEEVEEESPFLEEHPGHPEGTFSEVTEQEVVKAEEVKEIEEEELLYFSMEDYEENVVTDIVQGYDGQYYEIVAVENTPDADYFVCRKLNVIEEEEVVDEVDLNVPAEEHIQVDLDAEEDDDWDKLTEAGIITEVVQEPVQEFTIEDLPADTDIELSVPDQEVVEEVVEKVDPIKLAMAEDIEDIYGYVPEFTYTQSGSDYNVVLETGETIVLNVNAIAAKNQ